MGSGYSPKRTGTEAFAKIIRDLQAAIAALNMRISALGIQVDKADNTVVIPSANSIEVAGDFVLPGRFLVYDGTPTSGNLLLAISPTAGTDSYGNAYNLGVTLPGFPDSGPILGSIHFPIPALPALTTEPRIYTDYANNPPSVQSGVLNIQGPTGPYSGGGESTPELILTSDLIAQEAKVLLTADNIILSNNNWQIITDRTNGLTVGFNGLPGKYYYEEVLMPAQSITNGIVTQVAGYTSGQVFSDYGSAWNLTTGVWTCPVTSVYDWTTATLWTGSMSGNRCFSRVCSTYNTGPFYLVDDVTITAGNTLYAAGSFYATAGTPYHVEVFQGTTAAKSLQGSGQSYVHIGRRL